jgi:hypothetical protein
MTSKGTNLTNEIRAAISTATNGEVITLRCNAGEFWGGKFVSQFTADGANHIVLRGASRIEGFPEGFPDLLAVIPTTITPEMVGQKIALAGFIEVKAGRDTEKPHQTETLARLRAKGCRAGVARSAEEAVKIVTE